MVNNNYRNNNRTKRNENQNYNETTKEFPHINKKLSEVYNNPAELYLINGLAYQYADEFKSIKSHQIRKVLDGIKEALFIAENDLEGAKKKLYVLVAMSAYNAGRMKELKVLYDFIKNTITVNSIQDIDDIKVLDEFFTNIVAYHKLGKDK